jgi:photosystem II stability/assembly factor-like uncharacterized protein
MSWFPLREKLFYISCIYFADKDTGWAGSRGPLLLRTYDGGNHWQMAYPDSIKDIRVIYALNGEEFFLGGTATNGQGILMKTNDGGLHWQQRLFYSPFALRSIVFVSDSVGFISPADTRTVLIKTIDRGISWSEITLDTAIHNIRGEMGFFNRKFGWIQSGARTTNAGNTWQTIPQIPGPFSFVDSLEGWSIQDQGNSIYKTTNGGISWNLNTSLTQNISTRDIVFVSKQVGWVLCSNSTYLFKTTDGGNIWKKQEYPGQAYNLFCFDSNNLWCIGRGIIHTTSGGEPTSVFEEQYHKQNPDQYLLYQNYPNPFNPSTTIRYSVAKNGLVLLKIYDMLGREVKTLVNEEQAAGKYSVVFDGLRIASGVYFYTLCAGDFTSTKKFILLK